MIHIIIKNILVLSVVFMSNTVLIASQQEENIALGAKLWSSTCVRCHNARMPQELSNNAWEYSMNHMRVRAGLTGKETKNILSFIKASK